MKKRLEIEVLGLLDRNPSEIREMLGSCEPGTKIIVEQTGYDRRNRELALGPRISDLTEQGIDIGKGKEHQYRISYQNAPNGSRVSVIIGEKRTLEDRRPGNFPNSYHHPEDKSLNGIEHFNGEGI